MKKLKLLLLIPFIYFFNSYSQLTVETFYKSSIDIASDKTVLSKGLFNIFDDGSSLSILPNIKAHNAIAAIPMNLPLRINTGYLNERIVERRFVEQGNNLYYKESGEHYFLDSLNDNNRYVFPTTCKLVKIINDIENETLKVLFARHNIKSNLSTSKLYIDSFGNYWVSTRGSGVYLIKDGEISHYKIKDGLTSNFVYDICEGKDGNIWFASNNGLSVFSEKGFKGFKKTNNNKKLNEVIYLNQTGGNNIIFITMGGEIGTIFEDSIVINQKINYQFYEEKRDDYGNIWLFFDDNSKSWVNVVHIDPYGKFHEYPQMFSRPDVASWKTYIDVSGRLWVATSQFIGYLIDTDKGFELFSYNGFNICYIMEDDNKRLWFISNYGGAWFDLENNIFYDIIQQYDKKLINTFGLFFTNEYHIRYCKSYFIEGQNDHKLLAQYFVVEQNVYGGIVTAQLAKEYAIILHISKNKVINILDSFDDKDFRVLETYVDSDGYFWIDTPTQIHRLKIVE